MLESHFSVAVWETIRINIWQTSFEYPNDLRVPYELSDYIPNCTTHTRNRNYLHARQCMSNYGQVVTYVTLFINMNY